MSDEQAPDEHDDLEPDEDVKQEEAEGAFKDRLSAVYEGDHTTLPADEADDFMRRYNAQTGSGSSDTA
jgi:hypothetical protein